MTLFSSKTVLCFCYGSTIAQDTLWLTEIYVIQKKNKIPGLPT